MFKPLSRYVLTFSLIILFSCRNNDNTRLSPSTGRPGSIVVASDGQTLRTLTGDINHLLLDASPGFPDPPFIEILRPDSSGFLRLFYNQKNVLILVTSSNVGELEEALALFKAEEVQRMINDPGSKVVLKSDVLAKPQNIAYLFGKDADD